MAEFTEYLEDSILEYFFRNNADTFSPVATLYLSLHTTTSADTSAGTEVSGNGYARQGTAFDAAVAGVIDNTAAESFTASGGNFGTVVSTAIYDALTVGNMYCFDNDFTDTAVNDGNTLEFAAGAITITVT